MENYEQKYKEALEWIRSIYPTMQGAEKEDAEHHFPELKESEDERIRKEITEYITRYKDCITDKEYDSWISWFEKQGEKTIPEDINEAALQYVDTCAVDGEITHDNVTEPYWNNHSMMNAYKAGWLEKQGEKKSAWSEEDEKFLNYAISLTDDAQIKNFLKSLKDRVQPQPKQEWSEEDSKRLYWVIQWLSHVKMYNNAPLDTKHIDEDIKWLKSIKPNHWKPSNEQMQALFEAKLASIKNREYFLGLLYEDLKKL